jgi:transcriptional regulator with XRE-family HTH domain
MARIVERIRGFMERYRLSRREMAAILKTPDRTLGRWLNDDRNPPTCMLALMDMLETQSRVRTSLGVHKARNRPLRGRPFVRGNPYRFGDKRRETALGNAARSPE